MRVCVIDIAGASARLIEQTGAGKLWLRSLVTPPSPMRSVMPALTATVHASMTTGAGVGTHGVVAGGIFRRQSAGVSLSERSNTLLNKKRFWHARRLPRMLKTALVFWSNPLAGAADYVVGCHTYVPGRHNVPDQPAGLYAEIARAGGEFDLSMLYGPSATWRCCQWISAAARHVWATRKPDLQWVYMPGVNFECVRHGPESEQAAEALRQVDALAAQLAQDVQADGSAVVVVSNGGYVPVHRAANPNYQLRQAGLLKLAQGEGGTFIDLGASRAFAMVDHQVAHVFCQDESVRSEAAAAVAQDPAVAAVLPREDLVGPGLGRDRAGELMALAAPDAWMSFCWWGAGEDAPEVARRFDPTGKCGYDPCELLPAPPGSSDGGDGIAAIDSAPQRVRGSRGLVSVPPADQCFWASSADIPAPADVTGVAQAILEAVFGPSVRRTP
jgi:predicted AlkP superfamily pyrophosphatase or phosphodiesterase